MRGFREHAARSPRSRRVGRAGKRSADDDVPGHAGSSADADADLEEVTRHGYHGVFDGIRIGVVAADDVAVQRGAGEKLPRP